MDPVTHFCSGIVAKNFISLRKDFKTTVIYGLVAMSPDIDNFIGLIGNPFLYILHHRGFTHSFFGGFLLAYLLFLVAKMIKYTDRNLLKNFFLLILIHIFLDLITNYGTQIFLPFNNDRIALDAIFIIDPIYLIILIISYLITKKVQNIQQHRNKFSYIITLILIFIYPLFSLLLKTIYENTYYNRNNTKVTVAPLTPIFWKIIEEKDDKIEFYFSFNKETRYVYDKIDIKVTEILEKDENLKIFKWFLKYPYMNVKNENGHTIYEIADLRFEFPKRENPFKLKLIIENDKITYSMRNYSKSIPKN